MDRRIAGAIVNSRRDSGIFPKAGQKNAINSSEDDGFLPQVAFFRAEFEIFGSVDTQKWAPRIGRKWLEELSRQQLMHFGNHFLGLQYYVLGNRIEYKYIQGDSTFS